jgi:pimeloyl-ACP methyl ester carboxylesterase
MLNQLCINMRLFINIFSGIPLLFGCALQAQILSVDSHTLHYESWGTIESDQKPTIVLLSGPIDTWHSDSAWWASLGPQLAKEYRVIALDRASVVLGTKDANVGYQHFAQDLELAFEALKIRDAILVAFASSNISTQLFLAANPSQQTIKHVILIDPDVLSPFSIKRYKNDAASFKQNLTAYLDYVVAGNYLARTEQKNTAELAQLRALVAPAAKVDWQYIDKLQRARLVINNQVNLFNEIAIYDQDLDAVAATQWPPTVPLTLIDTDFEAEFIETAKDQTEKNDLVMWQQDARIYYQQLASLHPSSRYIASSSRAHLFQFAELNTLMELIKQVQLPNELD